MMNIRLLKAFRGELSTSKGVVMLCVGVLAQVAFDNAINSSINSMRLG